MENKPKIFVFINSGRGTDFVNGCALAESGDFVAGHCSSNEWWFEHDMGLTSDWKHKEYAAHYPDGYELVHVADDVKGHSGIADAYAKHVEKSKAVRP